MRQLIKFVIFPILIFCGISVTLAQDHPIADAVAARVLNNQNNSGNTAVVNPTSGGNTAVINPTSGGSVTAVTTGAGHVGAVGHPAARANPHGTPNTRQFRRNHGAGMNRRR